MTTTGDVEIVINDGGAGVVSVPSSSVQVIIGPCQSGTLNTVFASRDANAIRASLGSGPTVEYAGAAVSVGATALIVPSGTTTSGVTRTVTKTGTGTSVMTATGSPLDTYYVTVKIVKGSTVGTTGALLSISLDAGRTFGPDIALGTAVTLVLSGTGITLNFATGFVQAGDTYQFGTSEPRSSTSDIQAAMLALDASPYSSNGWGSLHIIGSFSGAQASALQTFAEALTGTKTFTRVIISARDAIEPAPWNTSTETESAWSTALGTDFSAVSAKRVSCGAGHYNILSVYPVSAAGLPVYRRPGTWAYAMRQVTIEPQTHAGRVSDRGLASIIIDPTNDPLDGFIYHDERTSPSLNGLRFVTFRKRKGKGGFFVVNPNLMSPAGSTFTLLPLGNVMDIGCSLLHQTGEEYINSDVKLNKNGTIDEAAAQVIESAVRGVLRDQMLAKNMISSFTFGIDRTRNILANNSAKFLCTVYSRGYLLQIDVEIGFGPVSGG